MTCGVTAGLWWSTILRQGDLTPEMDRSPLADLLKQMLPHLRRLVSSLAVHWMRSHGTCKQAVEQGVPELAWLGNEKADQAAKAEALRLAPSEGICRQRAHHICRPAA